MVDVQGVAAAMGYIKVGLKAMSAAMLDPSYTKSKSVTCSNWEHPQLTQKQVRCAPRRAAPRCRSVDDDPMLARRTRPTLKTAPTT